MKSNVSEYLKVARAVYIDSCAMCVADVSDLRDLDTIQARVKKEGLSFLTITLPQFAKDFERCLELGFVDPTLFRSFRKSGSIPAFLQGMTGLIFDRETGRMRYVQEFNSLPSISLSTIVDSIRQICRTFAKVELDCTPERVQQAIDGYTTIEQSFDLSTLSGADKASFLATSACLWGAVLGHIDPDTVTLRHGPGATADSISGNQKFSWRRWHERLELYFPFLEHAYTYGMGVLGIKELELVKFVRPEEEQPVKVIPVPKTLKGPRIIAKEPVCMQYAQGGLASEIIHALETSEMTRGHVNFRDQTVNQDLALLSSKTGRLATIDLSDASDRVPRDLALSMFDTNPRLKGAVSACRSTRAELPNGTIIGPLKKFASMGSALCFPVEAMYFYTICVKALLEIQNLPVSLDAIFKVSRDVYIYGDDILVPTVFATAVLDNLQKYNCKVNTGKSFWTGRFRESCGVDAYDGKRVTPVYIRKRFPENRQQESELISHVATANLFYKKGYWRTCSILFSRVERILGSLPYVSETSPVLGRISFLGYRSTSRWNKKTHTLEVRGWIPKPVHRTDELEGYAALRKSLHKLEVLTDLQATRDRFHLKRSALHRAVTLKRGWAEA